MSAVGTSTDPGTWTAAGDWQGWNNAGNTMVALGGGVYMYEQALAPGWYQWKASVTGTWDTIGDDFRRTNSNTMWFEVTGANPLAVFQVNALAGTIRVDAVPEPMTLALLTVGAVAIRRGRRRSQV
jgi:hypothetical protein